MTKSGIMFAEYKNQSSIPPVDYHLRITFIDGKVTEMVETTSGDHYSAMPAMKVTTPSKLSNHKIQVSSLNSAPTVGNTTDTFSYLTDGKTAYVDFDGPLWVFDNPDSPNPGSSASFNVVESISIS